MALEKTRSRSKLTKVKKPPKKRKPLNNRRKFKAHDNSTKKYRRIFTDYQVQLRAELCRQSRLRNRTKAESALSELLRTSHIVFDEERIFLNGDRFVIGDFYIPISKLVIECDGSVHRLQERYDAGRDKWLKEKHKVKVIRFTNKEILKTPKEVEEKIRKLINGNKN